MAEWTYSITIINNTDRELKLITSSLPWGKIRGSFPETINAGENGEFSVYSSAGTSTGIELYFSMRDVPESDDMSSYGSFSFSLDMPYWKHKNTSSLNCTGMLVESGFEKIPNGAHDFSTIAIISTTLTQDTLSAEDAVESSSQYDWSNVESLEVVDPNDVSINSIIPDKNILTERRTVLRTEQCMIAKNLWDQISDKKYPEIYNKKDFVSDYFTIMIYELRKNRTLSIAANQSYNQTIEITNTSSVRRETEESLQIENVISAKTGSKESSLSETLKTEYQIRNLSEYCEEEMKAVKEEFVYTAADYDRSVVLWDLVRVLALYRKDKWGKIELIGIDDYYITDMQKTYA